MSDDDREPSSNPYDPPESEPFGERGMTYFGATAWVLGTTAFMLFLVLLFWAIKPGAPSGLIMGFGFQLVATLLAFFFIVRWYAPELSLRHFVGLRNTHFAFYPLAGALGALVQVPVTTLSEIIGKYVPADLEQQKFLLEQLQQGTPRRIAIFIILVIVGPILEEVFFRGALFRPLKKNYEAWSVVFVTGVLFGLAHLDKHELVPLALVGFTLGILRNASGSLVPGIIMHGTFNAISFWALVSIPPGEEIKPDPMPLHVMIAGSLFTLVALGLVHLLGERSKVAKEAQHEDAA